MTVRHGKVTLGSAERTDRLSSYWKDYSWRRPRGPNAGWGREARRAVIAAPIVESAATLNWIESLRGLSLVTVLSLSAWGEWQALRWIARMALSDV